MAYTLKRWLHFQYHMRTAHLSALLVTSSHKFCLLLGLICNSGDSKLFGPSVPKGPGISVLNYFLSLLWKHTCTLSHKLHLSFSWILRVAVPSSFCVCIEQKKAKYMRCQCNFSFSRVCRTITHPIGPVYSSHNHLLWTHYDSWMWALIRSSSLQPHSYLTAKQISCLSALIMMFLNTVFM